MIVHGQRFCRTLALIVTTSDTCHPFRNPNQTLSVNPPVLCFSQPTKSLKLTRSHLQITNTPSSFSFFPIFHPPNNIQIVVCLCVFVNRRISGPDDYGFLLDRDNTSGSKELVGGPHQGGPKWEKTEPRKPRANSTATGPGANRPEQGRVANVRRFHELREKPVRHG